MWFEMLTGFREESGQQVRSQLMLDGDTLTSRANERTMRCGRLETPTLAELRSRVTEVESTSGKTRLREVVADVQALHADSENAGAMFQVASQFNLLEMVSPSVSPEDGIAGYEYDRTQGPACAIACGAGTIYRNYFVDVGGQPGQPGQTADRQIDCLADIGRAFGNDGDRLWAMRNGYALATEEGLREISSRLSAMDVKGRDELRSQLRIGIQWDTQVTLNDASHLVSQVYGSALPVAYSSHSSDLWSAFGQLILEASYEAALLVGVLNALKTAKHTVYLTLLGGGAFGNADSWISGAIRRALKIVAAYGLDVGIVSYGQSKPLVQNLVRDWQQ